MVAVVALCLSLVACLPVSERELREVEQQLGEHAAESGYATEISYRAMAEKGTLNVAAEVSPAPETLERAVEVLNFLVAQSDSVPALADGKLRTAVQLEDRGTRVDARSNPDPAILAAAVPLMGEIDSLGMHLGGTSVAVYLPECAEASCVRAAGALTPELARLAAAQYNEVSFDGYVRITLEFSAGGPVLHGYVTEAAPLTEARFTRLIDVAADLMAAAAPYRVGSVTDQQDDGSVLVVGETADPLARARLLDLTCGQFHTLRIELTGSAVEEIDVPTAPECAGAAA